MGAPAPAASSTPVSPADAHDAFEREMRGHMLNQQRLGEALQAKLIETNHSLNTRVSDLAARVDSHANEGRDLRQLIANQELNINALCDTLKAAQNAAPGASPQQPSPSGGARGGGAPLLPSALEDDTSSRASQASTTRIEEVLGEVDPTLHHAKDYCFMSTEQWRVVKQLTDRGLIDGVETFQLNTIIGQARVLIRCQPLAEADPDLALDIHVLLDSVSRNIGRILGRVYAKSKAAAETDYAAWSSKRDAEANDHAIEGVLMPCPEMQEFYANRRREEAKRNELHKAVGREDRRAEKEKAAAATDKQATEIKAHQRKISLLTAELKKHGMALPADPKKDRDKDRTKKASGAPHRPPPAAADAGDP